MVIQTIITFQLIVWVKLKKMTYKIQPLIVVLIGDESNLLD